MFPPNVNPYDYAAANLASTQAADRYTRTPIYINNLGSIASQIGNALGGANVTSTDAGYPEPASGEYDGKSISVDLHGKPTWKDLQNALYHETIHAVLSGKEKQNANAYYGLGSYNPSGRWPDFLFSQDAKNDLLKAWIGSVRGGSMEQELPAYLGAYNGKQLPVTPQLRQTYINNLMGQLDPQRRALLQRVLAGYGASQK